MHARCMAIVLFAFGLLCMAHVTAQAHEHGMFFGRGTFVTSNKAQAQALPHPIRDYGLTRSSDRNKKPSGTPTFSWRYNPKRVDGQVLH